MRSTSPSRKTRAYRYRVRIVVFNPNKGREDVRLWCRYQGRGAARALERAQTDPVDHAPGRHAVCDGHRCRPSAASDMKVRFQVIRFNPADGVTVPHNFEASPGEVIGEPRTADIPVSDGTGKKSKIIDFNSHQIVLDVFANKKTGGYQHLPAGFVGPPITQAVPRPGASPGRERRPP